MARRSAKPGRRAPVIDLMRTEARHVAALNAQLRKQVKILDEQIRSMPASSLNSITRLQAVAQRAAMKAFLNSTFDDVQDITARGMADAAAAASQMVSKYENVLLSAVLKPSDLSALVASESRRAVSGLPAALQRLQGNSYHSLAKTVYNSRQLASGWVDNTINRGIASGWSARQLATELRNSIDPRVRGGVSYAAMRTARTEINNAYHAASLQRYEDSGLVDEVDWNLSSSHPEGDECDGMAADSPYKIRNVPQKPHPQCYCFLTPHLPSEEEFLDNLLAGKYGDEPWVANAKAAPPSLNVPSAQKIVNMEDEEEQIAAFRKVYEGRDYAGFRVELDDALEYTEDGGLGVRMQIFDKKGKPAGFATRAFYDDYVYHDTLELSEEYRGQGFGSAFSSFSEAWYRESGLKEIKLHAALSDGGYVWARAGYDWDIDTYNDLDLVSTDALRWNSKLEELLELYPEDEIVTSRLYDMYNIWEQAEDDPAILAAIDLAEIANLKDAAGNPVGRIILSGTSWRGRKVL